MCWRWWDDRKCSTDRSAEQRCRVGYTAHEVGVERIRDYKSLIRARSFTNASNACARSCSESRAFCATLIACGSPPPEVEEGPAGGIEAPPGKGAAWKVNWNGSSRQVQESLNFLKLAFSFRRAVAVVDLVQVREVLESAARFGLLEHPLFTQGLELLERVSASECFPDTPSDPADT